MLDEIYSGQLGIQKTTGLQTAWLLATLGSKLNNKKNIKRSILRISIPQVCNELIQVSKEKNIRYSSNLLYGISLMYKAQMNYFMNDISLVKTRLRKDFMSKSSDSYNVEGKFTTLKIDLENGDCSQNPQIFFTNDPAFNIEVDLFPLPDFSNEEPLQKRRKLQIRQYDDMIFPDQHTTSSFESSSNQNPNMLDDHLQTIDTFLNRDLQELDDSISDIDKSFRTREREANKYTGSNNIEKNNLSLDFEFNQEGQLIEGGRNDMEIDDEMMELINFNNQPLLPDGLDSIEQRNIVNDNDFQLHTDTNQGVRDSQPVVIKPKESPDDRFFRLLIDEATRISSKELNKSLKTYDENMFQLNNFNPKKTNGNLLGEVLNDVYDGLSKYSTNAYVSILGKYFLKKYSEPNVSIATDLNTILKELESITRLQNNIDEYEIGREAQRTNFFNEDDSNPNSFEFLVEENINNEEEFDLNQINNSRNVFALSFNGLDDDSRISTHSSQGRADNQSSSHELNYLQEESIKYLGVTELDTDATRINNQLVNFFNFLHERSPIIGETITSSHIHLNTLNEDYQLKPRTTTPSHPTTFSRVKFSRLIPNFKHAIELNEEPISRKLVANSFSSLLALATKNLVHLSTDTHGKFELLSGDKLCIMLEEISVPA